MHPIAPIIQELISGLRATRMPWLGDEIETHIRLGKIPLFRKGTDDAEAALRLRQLSRLGQEPVEGSADSVDAPASIADDGEAFTVNEQIDESIRIIVSLIEDRASFVDDSVSCLGTTFELENINITILDDENNQTSLLSSDAYGAITQLREKLDDFRQWLTEQSSPTFRI